jgi:peptidoglycan/LPS O-acetylase OafA/YrhL
MDVQHINFTSGIALVVLSLVALGGVLLGLRKPPRARVRKPHPLFEMSVLVMCVVIVVYLGTADWSQPRGALPLALSGLVLAVALGADQGAREY